MLDWLGSRSRSACGHQFSHTNTLERAAALQHPAGVLQAQQRQCLLQRCGIAKCEAQRGIGRHLLQLLMETDGALKGAAQHHHLHLPGALEQCIKHLLAGQVEYRSAMLDAGHAAAHVGLHLAKPGAQYTGISLRGSGEGLEERTADHGMPCGLGRG